MGQSSAGMDVIPVVRLFERLRWMFINDWESLRGKTNALGDHRR